MKKFVNSLHCHEISNNRNTIFQFCHFLCNITYKNAIKVCYICSFTAFLYIITNFSGFIDILDLPVDRLHSVCRQKCIRLAKMLASEKAIVCRQRTWMCRFQDQMFGIRKHRYLALRRFSPQHVHDRSVLRVNCLDDGVRKLLPPFSLMGICLMGPHSKNRIEQ